MVSRLFYDGESFILSMFLTNCDISIWEQVIDIVEKEAWKFPVVISREVIEGKYHVKVLEIISDNKIKIISKTIENEIVL